MQTSTDDQVELSRLRKTTRDLVAMSTLPAVWGDLPPAGVINSLAGVLLATLDLDLACICVPGRDGLDAIEIIRTAHGGRSRGGDRGGYGDGDGDSDSLDVVARAALDAIAAHGDLSGVLPAEQLPDRAPLQLHMHRLGIGSASGTIVIGARRAGFPSEHERVLLGVAANQAAVILQRRLAERALARSESRFLNLADAAPAMLWVTEADGTFSFLSRAWHEFTGQDRQQSLDLGWATLVHADERAAAQQAFFDANARRTEYSVEHRLRHADGGYRWVIASGRPRFSETGEFLGFVGNVLDISERKQAEQALHDTREMLATVFEALPVGVAVTDQDGALLLSNQEMHQYLPTGVLPSQDAARHMRWKAVHADGRPYERHEYPGACALRGERIVPGIEVRYVRDDGSELWTQVAAVPLRGRDNARRGQVSIVTNIDAFKRTETALRLAESQQRALFDEVARSNRNLSEFLAVLAHELRNPLAPILTGLELMRLRPGSTNAVDDARAMMERQVGQLTHLIDDLLDIARVTNGKVDIRMAAVDLNAIVANAVETSLPLMDSSGHAFTLHAPPAPMLVQADATRIAQVIGNLLTNAAKYTPPGGAISLSVTRDGPHALVTVTDNGIGIPEHALESVFEMFSQVGRNMSHAQGGLGIGLSLVRQLVGLHGGTVSAHSDGVGRGSTFKVKLGLDASNAAAAPATGKAGSGVPAATGLRILVTDDNVDAALTLSTLLELYGHDVMIAHDGHGALRVAAQFMPDVVFLDIGLPDILGYEVARGLRQIAGLEQCAIAAVSGWGAPDDLDRSSAAGFDRHFTKPVGSARVTEFLASLG